MLLHSWNPSNLAPAVPTGPSADGDGNSRQLSGWTSSSSCVLQLFHNPGLPKSRVSAILTPLFPFQQSAPATLRKSSNPDTCELCLQLAASPVGQPSWSSAWVSSIDPRRIRRWLLTQPGTHAHSLHVLFSHRTLQRCTEPACLWGLG